MGTAVASRRSKVTDFKAFLVRNSDKINEGLAKGADLKRIIKVAVQAYASTPALQNCTMESLYTAVSASAQLGLDPCGMLGSAYIVPYKTTAQLIIGYRGLIDLARRSGQIISIEAHVVHKQDRFKCVFGLEGVLEHEPCWDGNPGDVFCAYAVAKLKGGGIQFEVMTKTQIDGIRARSKAGKSGPWVTDYDEMAKKTVVRRLCKYLPLTTEMVTAIQTMDHVEGIANAPEPPVLEGEFTPEPQSTTEKIKDKLGATTGKPEPDRDTLAETASNLLDLIGNPREEDKLFAACGILAIENATAKQLEMLINKLEAPPAEQDAKQ